MEFSVGDIVVHPSYGIGRIENMEQMEYLGQKAQPFYMISIQNGTIWVPANSDGSSKLRPLSGKDEIEACRAVLRSQPEKLNDDRYQRKIELAERTHSGTMLGLCEVLRDLTARSWERTLNENDIMMLRKVNESVSREWAAVEDISVSAAIRDMNAQITRARELKDSLA
jgi:RNA polymerase-interacting CarD/CdnL/TRCF family regulator